MTTLLNSELDSIEKHFGAVALQKNGGKKEVYDELHWYNRGKEERKLKKLVSNGAEDDVVLYRYIPITELWKIFAKKKITLVNPTLWQDPFESPFFNAKLVDRNKKEIPSPFKDRYYAMCFTINDTSESMWKAYASNGEKIVRIKTTVGKIKQLIAFNNKLTQNKFYLGRVVYLNKEDISDLLKNHFLSTKAISNKHNKDQAKTLLIKRYAYNYEKEIRLIYDSIDEKTLAEKPKAMELNVPKDFISEVLLDPKMSEHEVEYYKQLWAKNAKILKCRLYSKDHQLTIKI
jgi:hypothetical protein